MLCLARDTTKISPIYRITIFFFFRFWKGHSKGLTLRSLYSGGKKLFVFASHGNNSKS